MTDLDKLEELERKATALPWRAGRPDATSYDATSGDGPYKFIYGDGDEDVVPAKGYGPKCVENSQLIEALRNAAPSMIAELRELRRIKRAWDAITSRKVVPYFHESWSQWSAKFDGKCLVRDDLLEACLAALEQA